jgi:hypothetical protein
VRAAAAREVLGSGADSSCEEYDDFPNISFFNFSLHGLFYANRFATSKHVFGRLNSSFSVCIFTGSVRDALKGEGPILKVARMKILTTIASIHFILFLDCVSWLVQKLDVVGIFAILIYILLLSKKCCVTFDPT